MSLTSKFLNIGVTFAHGTESGIRSGRARLYRALSDFQSPKISVKNIFLTKKLPKTF